MPKLYTAADVADLLQCHPKTVYRLAREDAIPYVKMGGMIRFDPESVEEWIKEHTVAN